MSDSRRAILGDLAEHLRFLRDMGVEAVPAPAGRARPGGAAAPGDPAAGSPAAPPAALEAASPPAGGVDLLDLSDLPPLRAESLEAVRADLGECRRCKLHATRTNLVFGVGSASARLMFVGEAPGADEDRLGEPFVGRAGQLLDRIIQAMGLSRPEVYIANVLKSRPPGNRAPEADEVAQCSPFLFRQIAAIAPEVIVALGAPAAQTLLRTTAPIGKLRGRFWRYRGIDLMPTYHPAFLLRSPAKKREVWEDMQQVMARLGLPGPR
jgi:uracil-DNA glycosylase family 4